MSIETDEFYREVSNIRDIVREQHDRIQQLSDGYEWRVGLGYDQDNSVYFNPFTSTLDRLNLDLICMESWLRRRAKTLKRMEKSS